MRAPDRWLVAAAFAAVYLVWGSTYLAIAWAVEGIPPMLMIGLRCLLAGGALYGWARWRGSARPELGDWGRALLAGTLLFVTGQAMLAWAETRIASGPAALIVATEPLFIVLLGWRGGRLVGGAGARPGVRSIAAIATGLAGVALLVLPGGGEALDPVGAGAALLASASWSVGVFRARVRPGLTPAGVAGMQLLAAGGVLLAVSTVTGTLPAFSPAAVAPRAWLAFGYLVVFGSVVTYGAYIWLLERVGATRLSSHAYVNPVVAVALGVLLAGEPATGGLAMAMLLILVSVVLLVRAERPEVTRRRPRAALRWAAGRARSGPASRARAA